MSDTNASGVSFVRHEMRPELPPPPSEAGVIKWLRENLFSSPVNISLTLASIYIVWVALSHVAPWMFAGIWDASSLTECRARRDELGYHSAACWAVITERWPQFIFGFYPKELYWRPILTFVLLCVALAPVLYSSLPRKLLIFSAAYPFIAVFLLWGGSIWVPVSVVLCLGLGYLAWRLTEEGMNDVVVAGFALVGGLAVGAVCYALFTFLSSVLLSMAQAAWASVGSVGVVWKVVYGLTAAVCFPLGIVAWILRWIGAIGAVLAVAYGVIKRQALARVLMCVAIVLVALLYAVEPTANYINGILPMSLEPVQSKEFGGFLLALVIGVSSIVLSLPIGILLALGRQSDLFIINKISVAFIEIIRGIPLIVWLFTASILLKYFLPREVNFDVLLRVIIMVTLFSSAYIAEVIRGGLAALPKGQYEAADALGLDYWKSMRLIILPQALKISIPGIVNTFIGLFKDTTLVVFIGLLDPIGLSNTIRASTEWNGIYWEIFIFIGLMFFIFCFFMSRYSQYLERKLRTDHR